MNEIFPLPEEETFVLSTPVSLGRDTPEYQSITLKEPTLDQTDMFYRERDKSGVLSGMGLLISLLSGVPLPAVRKLKFRDYKRCEVWLTRFLTWTPTEESEEPSGQT